MARQTIRRHGDRWALYEGDDDMARAEYGTLDEARLATGGDVEVDETPRGEGLGGGAVGDDADRVRNRDAGIDGRTGGAGSNDDTPREPQAGL